MCIECGKSNVTKVEVDKRKYFTLRKNNQVVNNVEEHLHRHFYWTAYKVCYKRKAIYIYVNSVRKQSQEAGPKKACTKDSEHD